ncbi:unnamed protein product [Cochlearia groenlandica]
MYRNGHQIAFQPSQMNGQDVSTTMMLLDPRDETHIDNNGEGGRGMSQAEFAMFHSKRLQSDLEVMGKKTKHHDDNIKFLQSQKIKLDESIVELQGPNIFVLAPFRLVCLWRLRAFTLSLFFFLAVLMSKFDAGGNENLENNLRGEEDIDEQIIKHEKSAAGVLIFVQIRHRPQVSQLELIKGVVGIVAKLGKVNDDNLSRVLSDYLGTCSMLAIVCKNYESVQKLEIYDNQGNVDRNSGLHGLGSSIGRTIEGHFDVICLENIRPYAGHHIADDPQRRLEILKPRLPNGECPPGFLGFAVNMIQIEPAYLLCVTSYGHGLRETLFYSLFSRLQVYKTRVDMYNALSCINEGAVSLDGGIIRAQKIFSLGNRDEVNVKFAKPTVSRAIESYGEMEKKMKELKWKKEKTVEDIKREKVLRDEANENFRKKKDEFVQLLAQSSSSTQVTL